MRNKIKLFPAIIFIALCVPYTQTPVLAQTESTQTRLAYRIETPTIRVALSDDHSIIIQRVLYTALKRSGYQMIANVTGMRTAAADVNHGYAAILPTQTDGWDIMYPNLIKVPVAIDNVEYTAYTRSDDTYYFYQWNDMAGLRLGYRWQNQYVAENIFRARAGKLVTMHEKDELWESLLNNETNNNTEKTNNLEKIRETIAKLEPMPEKRNPECEELTREITAIPGTEELVRQIDKFNFKQAALELAKLKKEWG